MNDFIAAIKALGVIYSMIGVAIVLAFDPSRDPEWVFYLGLSGLIVALFGFFLLLFDMFRS